MPKDLLELDLEQVNAVVAGYDERELDLIFNAIIAGHYAGYYTRTKKPKSPSDIISSILSKHNSPQTHDSNAPDITYFQEMEARFARSKLGGIP